MKKEDLIFDFYNSIDEDTPINISIPITKKMIKQIISHEIDTIEKSKSKKFSLDDMTSHVANELTDYKGNPIKEKMLLTASEASKLSGIGINRIYQMTKDDNCPYVIYVGNKRLIKRKKFEEYLNQEYSI